MNMYFDEISEKFQKNIPNPNKKYVKKPKKLDENFLDYLGY